MDGNKALKQLHVVAADLRERQMTTARANLTSDLTNGRAANWVPEVVFSPFRALSRRQPKFPSRC